MGYDCGPPLPASPIINGRWIHCECCFTLVYDFLVACVWVYRGSERSKRRAIDAACIRRLFVSEASNPIRHALARASYSTSIPSTGRELRVAIILNRFTQTLAIMFATGTATLVLGVSPYRLRGKSFYECVAEDCLGDVVRSLESTKARDSIQYMRFRYRDPRRNEDFTAENGNETDSALGGGAGLLNPTHYHPEPSTEGAVATSRPAQQNTNGFRQQNRSASFELEAAVFCTSDGLIAVLRKA